MIYLCLVTSLLLNVGFVVVLSLKDKRNKKKRNSSSPDDENKIKKE